VGKFFAHQLQHQNAERSTKRKNPRTQLLAHEKHYIQDNLGSRY